MPVMSGGRFLFSCSDPSPPDGYGREEMTPGSCQDFLLDIFDPLGDCRPDETVFLVILSRFLSLLICVLIACLLGSVFLGDFVGSVESLQRLEGARFSQECH